VETISWRPALLTAVAPAAWGTTYLVTERLLPPDRPLLSATLRALPTGLVLLAATRRLPSGAWWWRSLLLGVCNIGMFFPLLFLAAYRLPGGLASTLQATSPLAVMGLAALVIGERAGLVRLAAAGVGLVGVCLLVLRSPGQLDTVGLLAASGSVVVSALGFVLIKRWTPPVDMLTLISWQLVAGGLVLLPLTLLVEGPPPHLDAPALGGYLWLMTAGTGLAYYCWFTGLRSMPAGAVSLIGLINPVVGTALGVAIAGEAFGWVQALGMVLVLGGVVAGQSRGSADLHPDRVRGQLGVGVDHPEAVEPRRAGLDVGGEGAVGDRGGDRVEVLPGAVAELLDVQHRALAAGIGAGEVDASHRRHLGLPGLQRDALLRLVDLRRRAGAGARRRVGAQRDRRPAGRLRLLWLRDDHRGVVVAADRGGVPAAESHHLGAGEHRYRGDQTDRDGHAHEGEQPRDHGSVLVGLHVGGHLLGDPIVADRASRSESGG
jgi:probable blue pigment (indigoidine) exporter